MKTSNTPTIALATWILFSLALLPAATTTALAQSQTGTVEGRVQNEITGRYLNNSRISVKGTDIRTMSDEFGRYVLSNVPGGMVTLEVLYSGLEKTELTVSVPAGQRVTRDVQLAPLGASTVQMDAFEVASTKMTDQAIIAINEQRFSPNLKTVVSTGDLSEHHDGNIAEFLKFVPGISGNSSPRGEMQSVSVRGFPIDMTQVTQDGADVANAHHSGNSRAVDLQTTMSVSNLARVEVTKVPTPATGADTMAGSVNLISRSAFEAPRREFRYTATISGEHNSILDMFQGKKTYSIWGDKNIFYAWPALNFTYTDPVSEKFGYTIAGMYHQLGYPHTSRSKGYQARPDRFGSSPENPVYTSHIERMSGALRLRRHLDGSADWRVTPNSVISAGVRFFNSYVSSGQNGGYWTEVSTGTNANPTVPGGVQGSHGPDFTIGATGRGSLQIRNNNHIEKRHGLSGNLRYSFDNGDWKVDLKTSRSTGNFRYRSGPPSEGGIRNVRTLSTIPLRVEFHDIERVNGPGTILVFDNNENLLDPSSAEFWANHSRIERLTTLLFDVSDEVATYHADIRKALDFFAFPGAIQLGGARKTKERDTWNRNDFLFRDGPGTIQSPEPYLTPPLDYHYQGSHVGISPYRVADAFRNEPGLFVERPVDRVRRERIKIQRSEQIQEDVDAYYLQAEARLFDSRLRLLTGVRYEKTTVNGLGALNTPNAVWQRNPDGSFALDANGNRFRRPEAGASGSLEELPLVWQERAAKSRRTYDGYYPSVHLTYNFTEKLQSRAAFAKTYGRPNFNQIIPLITVSEFTDDEDESIVTGGRLNMRNPGLLPWAADNYDLTTEYYTDQGGVFSAGVFRKDVVNFFGSLDRPSTPQELDDAGVDDPVGEWETRTTFNIGAVRVNGVEFSLNQRLALLDPWLAGWGSAFRVFANLTQIRVTGARTNLRGFQPRSANWGFQFARKRVRASFKWNSNSDRPTGDRAGIGTNGENVTHGWTHLDVNLSYSWRPNLAFFINMKNVRKVVREQGQRSDELPDYAQVRNHNRHLGIMTAMGINGSF